MNGGVRLEHRLVLAWWFARQLGYASPAEMLESLKDFGGDWDDFHPTMDALLRGERTQEISAETLREYDRGICKDLRRMNRARGTGRISLKYFQYLALLASEHFLACRESPKTLAAELNDFCLSSPPGMLWPKFGGEEDLNKLALWMATGSGKTLLMHLHYLQFFRREVFSPDHVILLTPSEDLSEQHLREMRLSGIPCFRHGEEGVWGTAENGVRILECTKLRVGRRPGKGATEGTESFEGRNLVFADEGHKGAGGDVFMEARRELARDGFCFEYSATFGQALYAANKADLAVEYGRAIALDYSYKHFYADGYGKDFRVLNLAGDPPAAKTDVVMLGNLLSFCQQRMLYEDNQDALADYNLHSPLLLLLGTTVTGGKEETATDTDLARVLFFLHRTAMDEDGSLARAAGKILQGRSGIPAKDGGDAFAGRLDFLREKIGTGGAAALAKLREVVFNSDRAATLQLQMVRSAPGEIGLSAGGKVFGLAYVGNAGKLRNLALKLAKKEGGEIEEMPDLVGESLFSGINRSDSDVNVLIGAKKFMEGWSSWRVSGMGLLNVGASEGSQIIQLFGRGVRLKGREMSLKRASADASGTHPRELKPLETLNIFGSRANFVAQFHSYLEREGVGGEFLEVPIDRADSIFQGKNLLVPKFPPSEDFREAVVMSAAAEKFKVTLDCSTRTHVVSGENFEAQAAEVGDKKEFSDGVIATLDFCDLRRRLAARKAEAGFFNLLIPGEADLEKILRKRCFVSAPNFDAPGNFSQAVELHNIAFGALWKFAEILHRSVRKKWETRHMTYKDLEPENEGNFQSHYTVQAASPKIAMEVRQLLENCKRLYGASDVEGYSPLPRVYFDRHLYQPLLAEAAQFENDKAHVLFPPALNDGERNFVESLRIHLEENGVPEGEYFLLRNLSRGKGVGFFTDAGFYPDFILWIKHGKDQRIVFIEPHGLLLDKHPDYNPKVQLHGFLEKISKNLANIAPKWKNVRMNSFVISQTDAEKLRARWGKKWTEIECARNHILFPQEDHSHIAHILADKD